MSRPGYLIAATALLAGAAAPQAAAEPDPGAVGTAVEVVIAHSFTEIGEPDQCAGAAALAAVRRGSSVVLSEASDSADAHKVAAGQFFRSRINNGACQILYITSAPVMPAFDVQFVGPDAIPSATFGPVASEPVTYQPGIEQLVRVKLDFGAQP